MFDRVFAWNHCNIKRLSDHQLIEAMLSPHVSVYFMSMLKDRFRRRVLSVVEVEEIVDGGIVEVPCVFREGDVTSLSFAVNLLKEEAS